MTVIGPVMVPGVTNKAFLDTDSITVMNITSASATALTVADADTPTNYGFQVDMSDGDGATTGLKVTPADAGNGLALAVISSGDNENLTVDAKGTGTVTINGTATGAITLGAATGVTGALTVTSAGASALTVGRLGATTPAFRVKADAATSVTGVLVTAAASGGGVTISSIGETNVNLVLDAIGSGIVSITSVTSVGTGAALVSVGQDTPGLAVYSTAGATGGNNLGGGLYSEFHVAVSLTNHTYGGGFWINYDSGTQTAGTILSPMDNGIYQGGGTLTDVNVFFGGRFEGIVTSEPAIFSPFSLNTNNRAITSLFDGAAAPSVGLVDGEFSGTVSGKIPIVSVNGSVRWALVYTTLT